MRAIHKKWAMLSALAFAMAGTPASAEWVDWIAEAELPTEFNSNVNRSGFDDDVEWGVSWHPKARLGRIYQLGETTRAGASAEIRGAIYVGSSSVGLISPEQNFPTSAVLPLRCPTSDSPREQGNVQTSSEAANPERGRSRGDGVQAQRDSERRRRR